MPRVLIVTVTIGHLLVTGHRSPLTGTGGASPLAFALTVLVLALSIISYNLFWPESVIYVTTVWYN